MLSTQQLAKNVSLLKSKSGDSKPKLAETPSMYAHLSLRTKLLLPYLALATVLAVAVVFVGQTIWAQPLESAMIMGGITAVFIFLVGQQHAKVVANPIEDLMLASVRVGAGDYSVVLEPNTADEMSQLADSFNLMTDQLRRHNQEQVQKQVHIEHLFGQYVGSNIAQHILAGKEALGGQHVYATVLFADIRNFTAFSEKADLTELAAELNEYYTLMQAAIEQHGGVINKFGGDSLLALFGAPHPCVQHAKNGIEAALTMTESLAQLNKKRLLRGQDPIRIGIGINYGEMVIGNFGSEQRREYTVLGDSVNVAKRLSDLNKQLPSESIFVSEATLQQINGRFAWYTHDLGDVVFKGKEAAMTVYAVQPASSSTLDLFFRQSLRNDEKSMSS